MGRVVFTPNALLAIRPVNHLVDEGPNNYPVAAQKRDVVRVGAEHAGVSLGIPSVPALDLAIKQLSDGFFVGALVVRAHHTAFPALERGHTNLTRY